MLDHETEGALAPSDDRPQRAFRRARRRALEAAPPRWDERRRRHAAYYDDLYRLVRARVPAGSTVLDLGCGDGALLASLRPSTGIGLDLSMRTLREAVPGPSLRYVCADVERLPIGGRFDHVLAVNVVGYLADVWAFTRELRSVVAEDGVVVITHYNFLWEPLLGLAARLGLKHREPLQNWLATPDLTNLLELSDFEILEAGYRTAVPLGPPRAAAALNAVLARVPGVRRLGATSFVVARPSPSGRGDFALPTCTVVVPTRNERGTMRDLLLRLPRLGSQTEVIFVDGASTDGTTDEILAARSLRPDLRVRVLRQSTGTGKGDAVRKGFSEATGDVLMILDADLSVPPEDLPSFLSVLTEGRARFANGTRMVYPMERRAMRLANIAGNTFFRWAFTWILRQRVTDTLCGTKVLWARDYRRIAERRAAFGVTDPFGDFDLLFGAAALRLPIRDVPVRYRERTYGETKIRRWRHGAILLGMAARGAWKLRVRPGIAERGADPARSHFDMIASEYDEWKRRASYYYGVVKTAVRAVVPAGSRVLEVGCGTGDVLAALDPVVGVGTDISPEMVAIAARKHPQLRFVVHDLHGDPLPERFEYVVAVDVAEHVQDLRAAFRTMAAMLVPGGALVLVTANPAWSWILHAAESLRLKMPEGEHTWRSREELAAAAAQAGLRERSFARSMIVPKAVPVLEGLNSASWARGLRRRLGLVQRAVYEAATPPVHGR